MLGSLQGAARLPLTRARELLSSAPGETIALLEQALKENPRHPEAVSALALLADAYQILKRYQECGFLLESCTQLDPEDLSHHVRLCAFLLTRAQFNKAAHAVRHYLARGGSTFALESLLQERQTPRGVIRSLLALMSILHRVSPDELPVLKTMGDIFFLEERLTMEEEKRSQSLPLQSLPGISSELAFRLRSSGITSIPELAAASLKTVAALGLPIEHSELLIDIAASELYLAASQPDRSPLKAS